MHIKLPPLAWFGILYAVVIILALSVPPSPVGLQVLHVSLPIYRVIIFTVLIPYGMVWAAAFYAYESLEAYSRTITRTTEGKGYASIVKGLKVLAWGLILSTLLSFVLSLVRSWEPAFADAQNIINRYAGVGVALAAFILIQDGTFILIESARLHRPKTSIRALLVVAIILGAFFQKLVADNQSGQQNPYHLSFMVLLITVVIPYIYAWTIGILGTYELRLYARRIRGVLYQRALQLVAGGLTLVILLSIASQYLTAAFASQSAFSLGWLLIVVYSLLVLEAIGFALVAFGAKQLKKIEDV